MLFYSEWQFGPQLRSFKTPITRAQSPVLSKARRYSKVKSLRERDLKLKGYELTCIVLHVMTNENAFPIQLSRQIDRKHIEYFLDLSAECGYEI